MMLVSSRATPVQCRHRCSVVALAGGVAAREHLVEQELVASGQLQVRSLQVLTQARPARGAEDGYDLRPLRQQPGKGDLSGGCPDSLRQLLDPGDQFAVGVEVVALDAWLGPPEVAFRQLLGPGGVTGQEAAAERGVRD